MARTPGMLLDLDVLYTKQWRPMVRLALLLVDDVGSAEDVVQDAFVSMHRRPPRDADAAIAYLRTSVVNGARSVVRRRIVEGADHDLRVAAEHAEVIAALRRLPRRQREVLVLRYWGRLSEAEIARTLGVSTGTVKSTASRALDVLESMLGESR